LGREEVLPQLLKFLEGSPRVQITDLRLAEDLEPDQLKDGLEQVLGYLQKPIAPEHVARWKQQLLREPAARIEEAFGDWEDGIMAVSFAAAALLLLVDLRMPNIENEKPRRLAWQIADLAELVRKLMERLDRDAGKLEKLVANRAKGDHSRSAKECLFALAYYRQGFDAKEIAEWLGINPYNSQRDEGTKNWAKSLGNVLARGVQIERERFPGLPPSLPSAVTQRSSARLAKLSRPT
jgi:hypothetical protein